LAVYMLDPDGIRIELLQLRRDGDVGIATTNP
jgi:hypothetical protein